MPSTRRQFFAFVGTGAAGAAVYAGTRESQYSPGTDESSEWPMSGYDPRSTAFNPDAAAPRDGVTVRWQTATPSKPSGRPVVASDVVVLPTPAGLIGYDLEDGSERWRVGGNQPWPRSPVIHDGTVYAGFGDPPQPSLRALDVRSGDELWSYDTRGYLQAPPVPNLDSDGGIRGLYVGDDTGRIYSFEPETGTLKHSTDVFGTVTCLTHGLSLTVGTEGGEIFRFLDDGDRFQGLWRRKLGGKVTSMTDAMGDVIVATFGGPLYRLQDGAHAGRSRWTVERGAIDMAATGREVIGSDGGGLRIHDERTGDRRWGVEKGFSAAPAVAGDMLIAGGGENGEDQSGFVSGYRVRGGVTDAVLGRDRWTFETETTVTGGVTVADGAVFAGTQGFGGTPTLYALDPA